MTVVLRAPKHHYSEKPPDDAAIAEDHETLALSGDQIVQRDSILRPFEDVIRYMSLPFHRDHVLVHKNEWTHSIFVALESAERVIESASQLAAQNKGANEGEARALPSERRWAVRGVAN